MTIPSDFIAMINIGWRFDPTDELLINSYLLPKVTGVPLPPNLILERDVYAAPPWIVFADIDDSSPFWHNDRLVNGAKKSIYVFTKVAKKTVNSTTNARIAGCGTWSGSTGPNVIRQSSGQIIGVSRMFTFESPEGPQPGLGHWIMYEYCLSGLWLMTRTVGPRSLINDVVLCKITKGIKRPRRRSVPRSIDDIRVPAESSEERTAPAEAGNKRGRSS